jgi:hypothetical protein
MLSEDAVDALLFFAADGAAVDDRMQDARETVGDDEEEEEAHRVKEPPAVMASGLNRSSREYEHETHGLGDGIRERDGLRELSVEEVEGGDAIEEGGERADGEDGEAAGGGRRVAAGGEEPACEEEPAEHEGAADDTGEIEVLERVDGKGTEGGGDGDEPAYAFAMGEAPRRGDEDDAEGEEEEPAAFEGEAGDEIIDLGGRGREHGEDDVEDAEGGDEECDEEEDASS